MAYAKEPWTAQGLDVFSNEQSGYVCTVSGYLENARRIVACVNACAGIPNEALETVKVVPASDLFIMQTQRDELLSALKEVLDPESDMDAAFKKAYDAIRRVENA